MRFLRSVGRSSKLLGMIAYAVAELLVKRPATRVERAEWLHRFCGRALRELGIGLRVVGKFPERGVVISNHLGYLDVIALAAMYRVVFVSKLELLRVPVLGWLTMMAGTVYVERGHGGSAIRAKSRMNAAAEEGLPVVFFPEGTTSNGHGVLKFHSGLLAQSMEAGQAVTAAFVRYRLTEDNGPGVSVENDVCYWGAEERMFRHMFRLLALRGIEVEVQIAEAPIAFSPEGKNRKVAAVEARAAVMALGGVVETAEVLTPPMR